MELADLIDKNGVPSALIDYSDGPKVAVWGFTDSIKFDKNGLFINDKKIDDDPLVLLQKTINSWSASNIDVKAVGFLSYNFNKFLYPHLNLRKIESEIPYFWFGRPDRIESYSTAKSCDISDYDKLFMTSDFIKIKKYKNKINKIKNELRSGNCYQINFTTDRKFNRLKNPFQTYLKIRNKAKPKFGYYINFEDISILSFSPEKFIGVKNNIIESWPMKGTRARSDNSKIDSMLAKELKSSSKDFSEHLMILDLIRNDIGKISDNNTIKVDPLFHIESYPTVHQMISRVYGNLLNGTMFIDVIKAMFPCGSVTGAPKESSMEIIDTLEEHTRCIYTGAIGHFTSIDEYEFNVAIRTLVSYATSTYGSGGGIVWDSDSNEEYDEIHVKARVIK